VKKAAPKQSNPGTWNDENKVEGASSTKDKADGAPTSPLINQVDEKLAAAFPTNKPHEDQPDLVSCKHCKRPVLRIAAASHIRECLKKKQEKLQKKKEAKEAKDAALRKEKNGGVSPAPSIDDAADNRARKSATGFDGAAKKSGKKRKADDDAKGASAKKKKKEDPKAKAGKAKGPVDVEKQCGVVLNNGAQCARSLTCKSHSMGAKRAVPGRSMPYDVLLAQYQKKNQAKQQRKFTLFTRIQMCTDDQSRCRNGRKRTSPRRFRTPRHSRLGRRTRRCHGSHPTLIPLQPIYGFASRRSTHLHSTQHFST
jgi:SAGA-associated factor 73